MGPWSATAGAQMRPLNWRGSVARAERYRSRVVVEIAPVALEIPTIAMVGSAAARR